MKLDLYLKSYTKIKWIKVSNVRGETIKFLGRNIGEGLHELDSAVTS